jgi:lipid-A-disaccharide synthase-like uncharacterized protein
MKYLMDILKNFTDIWVIFGLIAQAMFTGRFFIQWIVSERKGESTVPLAFWIFSVFGGFFLLIYAIHKKDLVFIVGQAGGLVIYARNLMLIYNSHQRKLQSTKTTPSVSK